jgi:hypothetical protein
MFRDELIRILEGRDKSNGCKPCFLPVNIVLAIEPPTISTYFQTTTIDLGFLGWRQGERGGVEEVFRRRRLW